MESLNSIKASERGIIPDFCQLPRVFMLVLLSELLAVLFTLLTHQIHHSFWLQLGENSLFTLWVSLGSGAILCLLRRWLNDLSIISVTLFTCASVSFVTMLASLAALFLFYNQPLVWFQHQEQSWFIFRNTLSALLITLVWMRYLYLRQQVLNGIVSESEAQFKALQARIQPHFLFNTLNTIASLIAINAQRAESTLEHLSVLLRSSLKPAGDLISLSQEIELCKNYLEIEKERLGPKLTMNWNVALQDIDSEKFTIPPFTLQPLVENAVYHGIQRLAEGGLIEINIEQVAIKNKTTGVQIKVSNPLPDDPGLSGNQMAQSNIEQRLSIRYGPLATMKVNREQNQYSVTVTIPELNDESINNR
ncbi:sensor histidine kinase [Pleionea sediminis]|uniref:sensor histidine kinase n=1 Tax=Pleionea sediminis TaxID=2569479 RepID=UPI00118681B6|nr:histidine kinase [Pleionea sediminis]